MDCHDLVINHLTVAYQKPALWDITARIPPGTLLAVVGPNGAGKSTLIKTIAGLIKPCAGTITMGGQSLSHYRRSIAYVPQRLAVDWDFPLSAVDLVIMGRYGALGWLQRPTAHDKNMALTALDRVGMLAHSDTPIRNLSGGQQQRLFIARALVQQASLYLMDEPFIGIDIPTEKIIIELLKELRNQGKTIIVVHHDLATLADYFEWSMLLNVKLIAYGPISTACTHEHLQTTYGKAVSYQQADL